MKLPLIFFTLLFFLIVFLRWRANRPKEERVEKSGEPQKLGKTGKEKPKSVWGKIATSAIMILIFAGFAVWAYNLISGYMHPKAPQTRVVAEIPKCAGDYDFSRIELPAGGEEMRKITVNFRPDCRTEVSLPPCANYRTRPTTDYEIRFIDGAKFIGGPGKQTWFGVHRGLFAVQGLTKAGTLEIFLEKK